MIGLMMRCLASILLVLLASCCSMAADQSPQGWVAPAALVKSLQASANAKNRQINYREEDVPEYVLPDPLVMLEGSKVADAESWRNKRRPEILELFRKHVYGRAPLDRPAGMTFRVFDLDREAMDGQATRKQVEINFTGREAGPAMKLLIFLPNRAAGPVPVFLLICHRGVENIDPARETKMPFWPAEQIVARGYGAAAFFTGDVDPDRYDKFQDGVHGLFDDPAGRPDDAWGTLAAWAWGASRAMDYLETDDQVDRQRVAVVGHSRGGKTSLWAGAQDERFGMVASNNSGCGGAALSRRRYGETAAQINRSFPHWFSTNFKQFGDREADLPVDQHQLMALVAPRLLYVVSANEDLWADPRGEYLAAVHASPVFELLGARGLGATPMPPLDQPLHDARIGYHVRTGGHGLTEYDWQQYMDFADKHLRPAAK